MAALNLILSLGAFLAMPAAQTALKVGETMRSLGFFQERLPSQKDPAGEILYVLNGEEIMHVDWSEKGITWRLPDFKTFSSWDVQGSLVILATMRNNLQVLAKRSNWTRSQKVAPSASVYPRTPVEMGDPNVLVCLVDRFFPAVLNITWHKNGQQISVGVEETDFYPSADATFRKFSYLPFVPEEGDIYTCQVEHLGLSEPLTKIWNAKAPTPLPETMENMLCILGLAIGIVGIVTGTVLFFKALRMKSNTHGRGPI